MVGCKSVLAQEVWNLTTVFYEKHYGRNPMSARVKAVARVLATHLGEHSRWLDIGCGNMDTSVALVDELRKLGVKSDIRITGWDVSHNAVQTAQSRGFLACQKDVSSCKIKGSDEGSYDVILFLEVIEHLVDTDTALQNIHKMMAPDALMVLSAPNLAAWYNRILLLAGYQPHGTEVSFAPYRFGVQFIGRLLGETSGVTATAVGHLRGFTLRALKELLRYHGFNLIQVRGIANHRRDLVSRAIASFWPGGSGNIVLLLKKRMSDCSQQKTR